MGQLEIKIQTAKCWYKIQNVLWWDRYVSQKLVIELVISLSIEDLILKMQLMTVQRWLLWMFNVDFDQEIPVENHQKSFEEMEAR